MKRVTSSGSGLSEHEIRRFMQCVMCAHDPRECGCGSADEDETGMCTKYEEDDFDEDEE